MCKTVYLTRKSFNRHAKYFVNALEDELRSRKIKVVSRSTNFVKAVVKKHREYSIAIAIDFFNDHSKGGGLTLNKRCSEMSRVFSSILSDSVDRIMPRVYWRDFRFVSSDNNNWYKYFNNVSAETKVIFYLCTINNVNDLEIYRASFDKLIKTFADEIVRCLRSNNNYKTYIKSVKIAKLKLKRLKGRNL